ncbi:hypothetical protein IQ237_23045 [Sphaerospermopsis sp. LEGE 08334]|nr:hypothetical protein [Sphaerospermopsis sp. LEGE 08334]
MYAHSYVLSEEKYLSYGKILAFSDRSFLFRAITQEREKGLPIDIIMLTVCIVFKITLIRVVYAIHKYICSVLS